jgi:hypothetical protein
MSKIKSYEEAVARIEVIMSAMDDYKAGKDTPDWFVYKEAIKELMTLKRGLARRKKESDD